MATTLLPPDRYARAIPARRRTAGRSAPSADRALAALGRSHLRVVEGGRSATVLARRRLYRRRRIGVALVTVAVVVAVVQLLSTVRADGGVVLESGSAAPALTAVADPAAVGPVEVRPHDAGAGSPVAGAPEHRVRQGDTLWSIATGLGSSADVRAVVDELAARTDGRPLQPGQRIDLRGLPGLER